MKKSLKLGCSSNCECGATIEEALENIKAAGFDSVMLAAKSGTFENIILKAKEIGLEIPFIHLSGSLASDIWAKG